MKIILSVLLVLIFVPSWTGDVRLPLIERTTKLRIEGVAVPEAARRAGMLRLVAAASLSSPDPAFGGFSAIAVERGRVLLLSDGGLWVRFGLTAGRPFDAWAGALPEGPGTGWQKLDRDSESMTLANGHAWIGLERANAIWRYTMRPRPFAQAAAMSRPPEMRKWRSNGGAEALARLRDGRFVVIAETEGGKRPRQAVLFDRDPTDPAARRLSFRYRPPAGYDPSDAAVLPDGNLLVLNRRWRFPLRFSAKLTVVRTSAIREGRIVTGREVATIGWPLTGENCEGVAVTRERGRTYVWIVTDNDTMAFRRTMLMKFRWGH